MATDQKKIAKSPQPLISHPLRETEGPQDPRLFRAFFSTIATKFPKLKRMLMQSQMHYTPAGYVQASMVTAAYICATLLFVTGIALKGNDAMPLMLLLLAPVLYLGAFIYSMSFPQVRASARAKKIDQEIVFAGRHMLIELKSGVPLFDAMLGVTQDYGPVSEEFRKIIEKVALGVPFGIALQTVAENNSSQYFNRLMLQMANSLSSGADLANSLETTLEQISREQAIELKAYGQKLQPIVMFFMIFGIIMPSLGVAFLIIMISFVGGASIEFGPTALIGIAVGVALLQFIFLSIVENSRPKFDIV